MPSHSILPSPRVSRNLALGISMPRSTGRNIKQRLGEKFHNTEVIRRSLGEVLNEWNDRRVWNENISSGPGIFPEPHPPPPPPPADLEWNKPQRRRGISPNIETLMEFNFPISRGLESEYDLDAFVRPERFVSNDFRRERRGEEQAVIFRNIKERSPALQDSFSSGGYHSFEARRGNSNFLESSQSLNYPSLEMNSPEYSGQRGQSIDQWQENNEPPAEVARKRRREPSPRGPVKPLAVPEIFDKVFHIGGYKLPYVTNGVDQLAQPVSKSFLTRFIKKQPPYRISVKKGKDRIAVEHVYVESVDVSEFEEGRGKRFSLYRFREEITKEFTKIYRARLYRNWDGWWKDFHSINLDIEEELVKFENFNVKYNFMPPGGTLNFGGLINSALIALTKNRNNYLGNFRVIYGLMNNIILGNMPMEMVAQLQDLIRSVPNHLWVYKLRSVVYLWYNYKQVIASKKTNDKKYQHVLKEWNSPVIHWVAKQAFGELRNISQVEYPEFNKLYGKYKDAKA